MSNSELRIANAVFIRYSLFAIRYSLMGKVTVTIDGRRVAVEPGTTVLEAARGAGIDIPTLCHVEGLEPASSCYLCAVQVEGHPNLSPSCALPVDDGMVVITDSDDVRGARKMALELLLSDHAGDCIAPCAAKCPAGLDIPGFVYEIPGRHNRRAMEIIADRLVLPGALGRICPRLCEEHCRRGTYDEGLAIGALHRYVADRDSAARVPHPLRRKGWGIDSPESDPPPLRSEGMGHPFAADQDRSPDEPFVPDCAPPTGKSVAIIGAGPAGLAAAYYLLQKGHDCTLCDAHPAPGGMLRYGIPAFRLPRDALDAEINAIKTLGAEFRMNQRWGDGFALAELRKSHDAVFIAVGAPTARGLGCVGEEHALSGLEFLERVAIGDAPPIGESVVVVGGGNTAIDAARTAVRLGASQVKVLYRRSRQEMPCLMEEVEAAEAEGVQFDFLVAPARLVRPNDRILHLTCQRMTLGDPDASGRRRPIPVAGSEFGVEAATVIAALGQAVDCSLAESEGLEVSAYGLAVHPKTLATNLPGVFAGGDAVSGPDLAVRAVAAGRLAAVAIDQYLAGEEVTGDVEMTNILMRAPDDLERAAIFREIEKSPRVRPTLRKLHSGRVHLDAPHRKAHQDAPYFGEVDPGLTYAQAAEEARRCLSCGCRKVVECRVRHYATEYRADPYRFTGERRRFSQDLTHPDIIYEPGKCIMCDACVVITREEQEPLGVAIVGRGFSVAMEVPFGKPLSEGLTHTARRCAEACPTGALALRTQRCCDLGCHTR